MSRKENWILILGCILVIVIIISTALAIIEDDKHKWHPATPVSGTANLVDSTNSINGTVIIRINLTVPNHASVDDVTVALRNDGNLDNYYFVSDGLTVIWQLNMIAAP